MNKQILRLAIPNILSNIAIPLLGAVDTAIAGHLDDVAYLGAIAVGSMIFNVIYWGFGFLRMGSTGLTAQAYGSKKNEEVTLVLERSLVVAAGFAALLILLQFFVAELAFWLVQSSSDVEFFGKEYFYIRIYAAPATLALYAFHGWFLGVKNAKYPMILSISVNVFNVLLNILFIYEFGMHSDGVALGTVCAQYMGLGMAVFLFLKKYPQFKPKWNRAKLFELEPIKNFFRVNFDIFIRTLALIFAFSYFTLESAKFGEDILAVNTILLQLWHILSYSVDGFAFAAESLAGNFIGEKNREKLKRVTYYIFAWGMGFGVLLSLVYLVLGESILHLFTDKSYLIELALTYLIWTIIAPVINSICFIWDGIFIGATATKPMRNTMIVAAFIFFFPVYHLTSGTIGNHSLWLAMISFMAARGISLFFFYKKDVLAKAA